MIPKNLSPKLVKKIAKTWRCRLGYWCPGLLLGISWKQPLDLLFTGVGFYAAFQIQKWGWELQAKRLVIETLDAIEAEVQADRAEAAAK